MQTPAAIPTCQTAHTPGPWEQEGPAYYEYDGAALCLLNAGNRVSIQLVGSATHKVPTEELEADASLIAAAPLLLGALIALVESYETHRPKALWDNARAAIAKVQS